WTWDYIFVGFCDAVRHVDGAASEVSMTLSSEALRPASSHLLLEVHQALLQPRLDLALRSALDVLSVRFEARVATLLARTPDGSLLLDLGGRSHDDDEASRALARRVTDTGKPTVRLRSGDRIQLSTSSGFAAFKPETVAGFALPLLWQNTPIGALAVDTLLGPRVDLDEQAAVLTRIVDAM